MSDEDFIQEAFAEISEMERHKLEGDETVRKMIAAPDDQIGVLEYGGVQIRFRMFLSKKLRHEMMKAKHQLENATDDESLLISEKTMYQILGKLCINEPWNDWKTWAFVDEKSENSGGVQSIFMQILSLIGQKAEDVKNFRRIK